MDILGYDSGEDMFHIFSVTNTAATHDHKGKWLDDNRIIFVFEGVQEGKVYKEEIEIKILNSNEFIIHETDTLENNVVSKMDVTIKK